MINPRDDIIQKITGILLAHGCNDQMVRNEIILALENYEISERCTDVAIADKTANEMLIKEYAVAKAVSGRSPKTIKQYTRALNYFISRLNKKLVDVTPADIRAYTAHRIIDDGANGLGLVNERQYLNSFFDWCVNNEYMTKNPVKAVEQIKLPEKHKEAFTDLELEKIRRACMTTKEKALVETLMSTACRVSELVSIKTQDIDGKRIMVRGKGNKFAPVYLSASAQVAIEAYLLERTDNNPYLFDGRYEDRPASVRNIERMLSVIGERAGVTDVHPHKFRHTAATQALRKGMKLEIVSKMLRHNNINTTMKYIDIDDRELEHQHERFA